MSEELQELLKAWLGNQISDERRAALLDKLRTDPAFRVAFATEARTIAMLHAVQTPEPRWLALQDELGLGKKPESSFESRVNEAVRLRPRPFVAAWWRPAAGLAVSIALIFATLYFFRLLNPASSPEASSGSTEQLAVAVRVDDVIWEPTQKITPREGDSIGAGVLNFRSGTVTLAYLSGVIVHVQGPAEIRLSTHDRIICRKGNLRAKIVPGAEGFTIETPGAAIVDLGTELGVNVDQGGRAQVAVYQGKAEAALLSVDGSPQRTQTLTAEQSVELDPRKGTMRSVVMRELLPAPNLAIPPLQLAADYPQRVLSATPKHYWRVNKSHQGSLPDMAANGTKLQLVGPIETLEDGSVAFIDSIEPQYLRAENAWQPPKEFAIELWFASTAFHNCTLAVLQASRPNHGDLALLELTQRNPETPFRPGRVRFLYRWPPGGTDGVNLYSDPLYVPYRWHHLLCQRRNNKLEMYLNGKPVGETSLQGFEETIACDLRFGRLKELASEKVVRQFQGRLAELAVYDRALSAEEIRNHAEALR